MKIVTVQDHLRLGGTERQAIFLTDFFRRQGHAARLLLFRPGGVLLEHAETTGLEFDVLQGRDTSVSLYAPGLLRWIGRERPDLVLCMGRTANCYAGFIQRRFPEMTVVGTLRTGKSVFPLHWWSLRRVRAILVNSGWWRRRLQKHGFDRERIHVVRNSVLLDTSPGDRAGRRAALRQAEGVPERACVFLNVASFRPGKRHTDLIRLFRDFPPAANGTDWRLWLVGDGAERHRCQRLAADLGLRDKVRFFGYQKNPYPHYCAADVAVSASQEDSLPNFLVEAQAMGLPLVAYAFRGVGECCQHGQTGYVWPAADAAAFRETLARLLHERELRLRLGRAAPAFAREKFSAEPQAARTLRFLLKISGQAPVAEVPDET